MDLCYSLPRKGGVGGIGRCEKKTNCLCERNMSFKKRVALGKRMSGAGQPSVRSSNGMVAKGIVNREEQLSSFFV